MSIFQWFIGLGANVMIPILLIIFALILGTKPAKAIKAGITIGIGFIGLGLVIGLLVSSLGEAAQGMIANFGLKLDVIDVGWPATSAIAFSTALGSLAIPIGIGVNIVLLIFGLTKTLDIDLWNFWHGAFIGSIIYATTNNFVLSVITIISYYLFIFWMADYMEPEISKFYGFSNITFPHGTSAPGYLIAKPMNFIFDRIPGFKDLDVSPEKIQKKFGLFGDSVVMGLIIGLIMGFLAGYDLSTTLNLGMKTAAVMMLMPRMVSLLMEGLEPISESASEFVKKRFPNRDIFIGMDSALSVGHPAVLSSSLILVPITILLAVLLPGNRVLPFGDLATIPFIVCLMAAVFRGNIIRTVLGGTVYMGIGLYIASWISPLFTKMAENAKYDLAGNLYISSLADGSLYPTAIFVFFGKYLPFIGVVAFGLLMLGLLIYQNKIRK
ncbi:PTS galactitol transporter subunit IIC [Streptobacillus felis]|uniref:PTS galactitol transporter subunit IIC n=1 Tax=Streptobacillus felis TaxID=1384509 RepID=A0A7Z0PER1_9FUSO|nr:PTS transporter subunit IIC [Streptobacillus felis]NYV27924.1 PTS galactitol transporter subunit IIC [Streptobacillus felis]